MRASIADQLHGCFDRWHLTLDIHYLKEFRIDAALARNLCDCSFRADNHGVDDAFLDGTFHSLKRMSVFAISHCHALARQAFHCGRNVQKMCHWSHTSPPSSRLRCPCLLYTSP